jgi:hypothetical protein
MSTAKTLPTAERDALEARDHFFDTVAAMRERLEPSELIGDAVAGARSGLTGLARSATHKARQRPVLAAAAVTGVLLLLMHRPLLRMIRRARHH